MCRYHFEYLMTDEDAASTRANDSICPRCMEDEEDNRNRVGISRGLSEFYGPSGCEF